MSAENITIVDKSGNEQYPKTLDMNVYDSNSVPLNNRLAQMSSDLVPYLSGSLTPASLETTITAGNNYTVPASGFYVLACRTSDTSHTRSAVISIGGVTIVRTDQNFNAIVCVPLKQGTVLNTRANVSSADGFIYTVISSFT